MPRHPVIEVSEQWTDIEAMNKYRNNEQCITYTVTQNDVATIYIFIGMWSILQNVVDQPEPNLLPNM